MSVLDQYPNMVIVRTLSKSHALAGMRLGYAIASPDMIRALDSVKNCFNSYPIDMIAQIAGKAAMESKDYYDDCAKKIILDKRAADRQKPSAPWKFTLPDSSANFLFAKHSNQSGATIMQELRRQPRILVRAV